MTKLRIRKITDKSPKKYFNFCEDSILGEGAEAIVYEKQGYAYKITNRHSAYTKMIIALNDKKLLNKSNYFPKIFEIYIFSREKYVFKMEILRFPQDIKFSSDKKKNYKKYSYMIRKCSDIADYMKDYIYCENTPYKQDKNTFNKRNFNKIINVVNTIIQSNGASIDLHDENVMIRGKYTPVIIDPLF